jgi:hypothetical protein
VLLKFLISSDPYPAVHPNADPDLPSKNTADPDRATLHTIVDFLSKIKESDTIFVKKSDLYPRQKMTMSECEY